MRRNPNRRKVCDLIHALRRDDYRPADFLASEIGTDKPFVYAWCHELHAAGLAEVEAMNALKEAAQQDRKQMTTYTTLNKIRAHDPCADGWAKLLRHLGKTKADDEPVSMAVILESNGLDDALWCLRACDGIDREARLFSVWCARQVQHLMADPRSFAALDVAEGYANGLATQDELNAAWAVARAVRAAGAARDAALAAGAARDAAWAAWAVARAEARDAQAARFFEVFG